MEFIELTEIREIVRKDAIEYVPLMVSLKEIASVSFSIDKQKYIVKLRGGDCFPVRNSYEELCSLLLGPSVTEASE